MGSKSNYKGARIPTTVAISADTLYIFDLLAERKGIKRSILLREAIDNYAKENDPTAEILRSVRGGRI